MNQSLLLNILIFYGILILVNVPAPFLGLEFEKDTSPRLWYAPPGFVIPIVWFVLFTMLGVARHILIQLNQPGFQWWLYALAILCATYAYYTLGLAKLTQVSALWYGLAGNIAVIIMTAVVVYILLPISRTAAYLTIPVMVWTTYASLIVLGEMKMQRLI